MVSKKDAKNSDHFCTIQKQPFAFVPKVSKIHRSFFLSEVVGLGILNRIPNISRSKKTKKQKTNQITSLFTA